jgi:hypothetical protein
MLSVKKLVEKRLARETEILGENPGFEPGPPLWKASD